MGNHRANGKRAILIVDGDPAAVAAAKQALEPDGHDVQEARDADEAIAKFGEIEPHLVILDAAMAGMTGIQALKRLRLRDRYVALMLASANPRTEELVRGLDAGADDYVAKPFDLGELAARVRAQLRLKALNDRLTAANERLQELVDVDDVTGLYNMRSIYERLDHELERARRFGRPTAAVMMDLDDFKRVNDSHDHLFGSFVLKEVGRLVRATVRRVDLAARYGGDEFLIVLPETDLDGAMVFSERLRAAIEAHRFQNDQSSMRLTASLGVAVSSSSSQLIHSRGLVRWADLALYEAKAAGKNCVRQRNASDGKVRKRTAG